MGGQNDACRFSKPGPSKLANEALHRLVAPRKALIGDQVLPDGLAIASPHQSLLDQLTVGFTGTRGQSATGDPCFSEKGPTQSAVAPIPVFAGPGSGGTLLAGFAGARRPQAPGSRTPIPAAFK